MIVKNEGLAKQEPESILRQHDLFRSLKKSGERLLSADLFQVTLEKRAPMTTVGQGNIARSHDKIGATLLELGHREEGLKAQTDARAIRERLSEIDRQSREWRDGYR